MPFSVKGGIPGERVVFEKEPNLDVIIWLHVKNGTHIKITPVTQDSSAKINGIDVGKNSVMRKGVKGVASRPLLHLHLLLLHLLLLADLKEILGVHAAGLTGHVHAHETGHGTASVACCCHGRDLPIYHRNTC